MAANTHIAPYST